MKDAADFLPEAQFDLEQEFKRDENGVLTDAFESNPLFDALNTLGRALAAGSDSDAESWAVFQFKQAVDQAATEWAQKRAGARALEMTEWENA